MSSSTTGATNPDGYKFECECGMKAPLRTALTEQNVGRRFLGCANYKGPKKYNFFDWFDPETCERGKAFGNWLVKKNQDLQMVIQNLQLQCKEQKKEMEHDFGLKMEEWNKKEEWYILKINLMNQKLKEMEDRSNGLKLKMEEMEANNAGFKLKKEEMEAKNDRLVKRNKAMKKEIEYGNLKVKLLIAMVVALVGIGIVCFGGQGMWKNKMLALP